MLLGNSTVGKTTFINSILDKDNYQTIPTVGIFNNSILAEVFNEKIRFYLIDTGDNIKIKILFQKHIINMQMAFYNFLM